MAPRRRRSLPTGQQVDDPAAADMLAGLPQSFLDRSMRLLRSMKESTDGFPEVGPSGRKLGVRPGSSPNPDVIAVANSDLVCPGQGGMSVAPDDPKGLPRHRKPKSLGGIGQDAIWYMDTIDLGAELQFRQDSLCHGVIEPRQPMTLQSFQEALVRTRSCWAFYCR